MITIKGKQYSVNELQKLVDSCEYLSELKLKLGYSDGRNVTKLRSILDENDINYTHFIFMSPSSRRELKKEHMNKYFNNEIKIKSYQLKNKLIEFNYFESKCARCGITKWLNEDAPLELHHKDGNKNNNSLENLELLCPNCHAFTDTYRGRNKEMFPIRQKKFCTGCNKEIYKRSKTGLCIDCYREFRTKNKQSQMKRIKGYCVDCGTELYTNGKRCKECHLKMIRSHIPDRESLKKDIFYNSFEELGRKYNVSGKAISKWCKKYNLPYKKKDINKYTEDEWMKL